MPTSEKTKKAQKNFFAKKGAIAKRRREERARYEIVQFLGMPVLVSEGVAPGVVLMTSATLAELVKRYAR